MVVGQTLVRPVLVRQRHRSLGLIGYWSSRTDKLQVWWVTCLELWWISIEEDIYCWRLFIFTDAHMYTCTHPHMYAHRHENKHTKAYRESMKHCKCSYISFLCFAYEVSPQAHVLKSWFSGATLFWESGKLSYAVNSQ